jgi:cysteine sulfinate desulfinase/cysteine desulfurase-like protein
MSRFVYADNAVQVFLIPAFNAMVPYLREQYGNPSSLIVMAQRPKRP